MNFYWTALKFFETFFWAVFLKNINSRHSKFRRKNSDGGSIMVFTTTGLISCNHLLFLAIGDIDSSASQEGVLLFG